VPGNAQKIWYSGVAAVLAASAALVCATGCATVRKPPAPSGASAAAREPGAYHTVVRGETLWRISKMYGSEVDRIASANNIQDSSQLEVGQRLFIPGGGKPTISFSGGRQSEDFMWPVRGAVAKGFGQPERGTVTKGINIVPAGDRSVKASRSGMVVFYNDAFLDLGNTVILDHGDGFFTVYGKITDVSVKPGDQVPQGERIAQVGAGQSFLHFEIRKGAISQNPNLYLSH
jgi:murein DD-endopeptidase MepM/ murein hydrolase activator NlpD